MAIQRIINRIDIQWDDAADPNILIVAQFNDDVEQSAATLHYSVKRSALGPAAQGKLDAFLADVLTFADTRTGGRGIAFPVSGSSP
jgi:hypothetical protein